MSGIVAINLKQRTLGRIGIMWKCVVPAREIKPVADSIARLSSVWGVKLLVGDQNLYHERSTGSRIIDHSRYVNKRLRKAGVEKIEIEQGTTAEDIELILNTLSNRGLNKAKEILEARSVIFHPQLFPES